MDKGYIQRRRRILLDLYSMNERVQPLNVDGFKYKLFQALATSMTSRKMIIPIEIEERYSHYNNTTYTATYLCLSPSGIGTQQQRSDGVTGYGMQKMRPYTFNQTKQMFSKPEMYETIMTHPMLAKEKRILERLKQIKELCDFDDTHGALVASMPLQMNVKMTKEHTYGEEKAEFEECYAPTVTISVSTEYGRKNVLLKMGKMTIHPYPSTDNLLNMVMNEDNVMEVIERALVIFEDRIKNAERDIETMTDRLKEMFPKEALMLLMKEGGKDGN